MTSIIAALGSVKTLWELARNAQDAQLTMKISAELGNIQGQLIDVQHQAIALLESVLNDLFATYDISVRDAFTVRGTRARALDSDQGSGCMADRTGYAQRQHHKGGDGQSDA